MVRKSTRARLPESPDDTIRRALVTGRAQRHDADGRPIHVPTIPELRAAWEVMGSELLAEHVCTDPGTRPWGWWRFEAPRPLPFHDWPLHVDYGQVESRDVNRPDDRAQRAFLDAHGLLTDDERLAMVAGA